MIFEGLENPKSYEYEEDDYDRGDYDKDSERSFISRED